MTTYKIGHPDLEIDFTDKDCIEDGYVFYPTEFFYKGHKFTDSEEERGFEGLVCVWDKKTPFFLDFNNTSQEQKDFCNEYFNIDTLEEYRSVRGLIFSINGKVSCWRGECPKNSKYLRSFNDLFKYSDEI